jgi:hypothetical protein
MHVKQKHGDKQGCGGRVVKQQLQHWGSACGSRVVHVLLLVVWSSSARNSAW